MSIALLVVIGVMVGWLVVLLSAYFKVGGAHFRTKRKKGGKKMHMGLIGGCDQRSFSKELVEKVQVQFSDEVEGELDFFAIPEAHEPLVALVGVSNTDMDMDGVLAFGRLCNTCETTFSALKIPKWRVEEELFK